MLFAVVVVVVSTHVDQNAMMVEELEISPDQETQNPYMNALVNFVSFLVFGSIPVLPFVVFLIGASVADCTVPSSCAVWSSTLVPLWISIGVSSLGLLVLGLFKAAVTGLSPLVSIAQAFAGAILSVAFGAGLGYGIWHATSASV